MSGMGLVVAMLLADPAILGAHPPLLPAGEEAPTETVVEGWSDAHARMTVNVLVHGSGPYRFLVDTGSQRTVVSTRLAQVLGLEAGPQARVVGIAATHRVATAHVETIAVGSRSFHDLTVPLLEGENIGADGILGTDSLQHERVLLDFTRNAIHLGDARENGGRRGFEIVVRARRKSGRLILTDAKIDGVHVDVVIDTGASGSVGNPALQRALAGRKRLPPMLKGSLSSVTGHDLQVEIGVAGKLDLAGISVSNVIIAYANAPAFGELKLAKRPAIFLGMRELRVFKRVAIDFSTKKVLLDIGDPAGNRR
jgi:predicted aspartyl protease